MAGKGIGSSIQADRMRLWLNLALVWQGVVCLMALVGSVGFGLGMGPMAETAVWLRMLLAVLLLLLAAASGTAVFDIRRRQHRGRTLSLAVNYLGFLVAFLGLLHVTGVFVGIDSLANTIGRGLPFLFILFLGYLIGAFGDRYEGQPLERQFRQVGQWIMVVSGVVALFAVGLIPGLWYWVQQLAHPTALGLFTAVLLFGTMAWVTWREPMARALQAQNRHEQMLSGYLFLSPNLLGFLFFFAGPLLLSFYTSFTNWDAFGTRDWVGLDNYAKILNLDIAPLDTADQRADEVLDITLYDELTRFSLGRTSYVIGAADKLFWISLKNTLIFALIAVPLSSGMALVLANLLNSKLPGMKFYRAIYFLPSIAAVVGIALVWQWLYNSTIGYINYGITSVVTWLNSMGWVVADPQIRWLSESSTALLAIIIVAAWQTIGFNTVLFLAGLQTIPGELYEAATVDGAGKYAQFRHVTIPMLAPTTFFVISTTTIQALQVFEQVFIMTNPVGGPNNATLTLTVYLYQNGFQFFKQGYGSAIAWILFVVIFGITLGQFQRQRRSAGAYDV